MPWWSLLIFGVALVAATAVVVYLLVRRVRIDVDRVALAASREAKTQALLEIERKRRARLEEIAGELETKLRLNREWMTKRLEDIDAEIDDEFRDLASSDDALFARLAELLRGRPSAGARGEGPGAEEGGAGEDGRDPPDPRHPRAPAQGERAAGPDGGGDGGEDAEGRGGEDRGGGGEG